MLVVTREFAISAAVKLRGAGRALAGTSKIILVSAPFQPNENLTLADVQFANFSGYVPPSLQVEYDGAISQGGIAGTVFSRGKFEATDDSSPNQIYGWVLYNSGTGLVYGSGLFPQPLAMLRSKDFILIGAIQGVQLNMAWGFALVLI